MNILFLCNKSPWPPGEGGPMAMNMLIEGLLAEGHRVRVLAVNSYKYNITPGDIPEIYRQQTGIELIDVDLRLKSADALFCLMTGRSYHVARFISGEFSQKLTGVLGSEHFDIVQLETLFMCPYIPAIREYSTARIILRAHNIEHLIWERNAAAETNLLKRWYLRQLAGSLKKYELEALRLVDGIAAITPTDAVFFRESLSGPAASHSPHSGHAAIPVLDLPFGIDPGRYTVTPLPRPFSLFSLGSMNWIPNQEGIRWFLQEVWPGVHGEFPELKFHLAGRGMPGWMLKLDQPGVVVLGEIPDAREFLASHAIMIVPLLAGSGIRVKIIEGMAAGRPVISTAIGAEGIAYSNQDNILIADTPCDFFEMIGFCLHHPEKCEEIGIRARQLAETVYNREVLVKKLVAFYREITG